jgi:diguanylate cyclase (GGDEF)-like protein
MRTLFDEVDHELARHESKDLPLILGMALPLVFLTPLAYGVEPLVRAQALAGAAQLSQGHILRSAMELLSLLVFPVWYLRHLRRHLRESMKKRSRVLVKKLERRIEEVTRAAKTDPLTGLPNRRCFESDWVQKIESRGACAFIVVDLDHFKLVNDVHGHQAGDRALVKAAEIGADCFRDGDGNLFRTGGEEFLAVVFGENGDVQRRAEEFRLRLERHAAAELASTGLRLQWPGPDGVLVDRPLTASVGVAFWPQDSADPRLAMHLADKACYAAKQSGRNRVNIGLN